MGMTSWVDLEMTAHPTLEQFGNHLLAAVDNLVYMAGQEAEPEADEKSQPSSLIRKRKGGSMRMPTKQELEATVGLINSERVLTIYTYGDKLKSRAAIKQLGSQLEVNAKPLNGRGGGADTKHNALEDERIMRNVASSCCEGIGLVILQHTLRKVE